MLANEFSEYFSEKIDNIRKELDDNPNDINPNENETFMGQSLDEFTPLTQEDTRKLIIDSNSKSCDLDPMPGDLLKLCINEILPIVTEIINTSLKIGIMPK